MTPPISPTCLVPACVLCGWLPLGLTHTCPPAFRVWREEDGEHLADTVHAYSHDAAARRWIAQIESVDSEPGPVARGDLHLLVCVDREGVTRRFRVTGTREPAYSAEEVE